MKQFKAGTYISQGTFRSFIPEEINRVWRLDDPEIMELLSQADRALGRLDMFSEHTPNIDLLISMHVIKEATQSTKIEGTRTSIEDALQDRQAVVDEERDDWDEVQNYIQAMNKAIQWLNELPLSSRLIRKTHEVLLQGVRGRHKMPGAFRTSQNWIGGATLADAAFIPPPHGEIGRLMADLEQFVHNKEIKWPHLLKIALIHYQFETIHPFLDGNGRVGRLLITLYLVEQGLLKKPILYLSDFFERNRGLYHDHLMRVRETGDLRRWFKFFLVGVIETAQGSIQILDQVMKLQREVDEQIQSLGSRASHARKVVHYLYQRPLIQVQQVSDITGLSMPSAYKLVDSFEKLGILKEMTGGKRSKQYRFEAYLRIFTASPA
jgi:Fic family protein